MRFVMEWPTGARPLDMLANDWVWTISARYGMKPPITTLALMEDTMTTTRIRSLVSLAAALSVALTMGACASAPSHIVSDASASVDNAPRTVRFDNTGREFVHVYLIGEQREWHLGRVEPGERKTMRIPDEALFEDAGSMQLAVIIGERVTLGAKRASRTILTIAQPGAALLGQRWTFSQTAATGQLTSLPARIE